MVLFVSIIATLSLLASALPSPEQHILSFRTDRGAACGGRLGLLLLSVDETAESDFRRYLAPFDSGTQPGTVGLYHARQFKGPDIDVQSLEDQKKSIRASAALLPRFPFDAVGFACTSDAAVLGPQVVGQLVGEGALVAEDAVTNPLSAGIRALQALNVTTVAMLTPYTADVTSILARQFEAHNISISTIASFNQTADAVVARIEPSSVLEAVEQLHALDGGKAQAVFISCTQTRTLTTIAEAERRLGIPIVSSNSALAWDMLRMAGLLSRQTQKQFASASLGGRLYQVALEQQGQHGGGVC